MLRDPDTTTARWLHGDRAPLSPSAALASPRRGGRIDAMLPHFDVETIREINRLEREIGALKARRRAAQRLPQAGEAPRLLQVLAAMPGRARRMLRPAPGVQNDVTAPAVRPARTRGT
jgi:hypothetical protein